MCHPNKTRSNTGWRENCKPPYIIGTSQELRVISSQKVEHTMFWSGFTVKKMHMYSEQIRPADDADA